MLPCVATKSSVFERDKRHITEKDFFSAKPRVNLKSSPMLTSKVKYTITMEYNSWVVYTFEFCCKNSYIGQTFSNLRIL